MFSSARAKLTLLLTGLVLLLYILTAGSIYLWMQRLTVEDEDHILLTTARPLAANVLNALNHGQFPQLFVDLKRLETLYPKVSAIVLRDALGHVLAGTNPKVAKSLPYAYSLDKQTTYVPDDHAWYRVISIHFTNQYGQSEGWLQLALNVNHDVESLARLRQVLLWVGVGGVALALAAGFFASHRALQPIARSWRRQQQFVADASHELRTPIAVIQANLDVVLGHLEQTVLDNLEWLSAIKEEARRLARLTDDLLTLARADSNEIAIQRARVPLVPVLREVCEAMCPLAEAKGLRLQVELPPPGREGEAVVVGDADRLRQLFAILIDNAVKYTPEGGTVTVRLVPHGRFVRVHVQDTGIGIRRDELRRIFDRFYRGDQARVRAAGGAGLGLAIARWIVQMHRGRITVRSTPGQGSEFTVVLRA
ncbi:hypothetical protein GCM10010885_06800 [Alicyclobacillus cellulosilyticus]|uniref:histidine kinase n=1 Tax=Alicyclobacillus cellulosilyticus TaxID=1003997 RepID=A0A917K6N2_9BACL|nr:ATP-binding protein [Alicyclobacillus cellulosilyticus]GGJ00188.1 hypothetical protein GCM10010885_06800 [Alicyclobacillus cellulosilyticus]